MLLILFCKFVVRFLIVEGVHYLVEVLLVISEDLYELTDIRVERLIHCRRWLPAHTVGLVKNH